MIKKDFSQHNKEAKAVWDAYHAGDPTRVPVVLGTSARYYLFVLREGNALAPRTPLANLEALYIAAKKFFYCTSTSLSIYFNIQGANR